MLLFSYNNIVLPFLVGEHLELSPSGKQSLSERRQ